MIFGAARAGPAMGDKRFTNNRDWDSQFDVQVKSEQQHDDLPQLALVTLRAGNKQRLFQNAIGAAEKSTEKTRALMARLEHFDPSTAQHFGYKSVAISEAPLRLLRSISKRTKAANGLKKIMGRSETGIGRSNSMISCSISDISFSSYIALSYCWHDQDWTPAPQCRRHEDYPISIRMLRALLDLRQSQDEGVWIDAVCIDQDNPKEKVHAIGSMDLIYKSARIVVVILEDVCLPDTYAQMIQILLAKGQDGEPCYNKSLPPVPYAFDRLVSSRWFSRSWCFHEFQMAVHSLFLVPTETGFIRLTMTDLANLHSISSAQRTPSQLLTEVSVRAFEILLRSYWYKNVKRWERRSPMAQFNGIIGLKSSHETDKIGIAINVAGLQLYYAGPEMSVHQCRWVLAMLALAAGDLTTLCGAGPAIRLSADTDALSWLRWYNHFEDTTASLSDPTFSRPSHIVSIDPEHIVLDLFILEQCRFHNPSTNSILIATAFLDRHSDDFKSYPWMPKDSKSSLSQQGRRRLIEVLACALDCGLRWFVESITYNKDVASEMEWRIFDSDMWPLVADLLFEAYPLEESIISSFTNEQKRSVSQYLYFTMCLVDIPIAESEYESGLFNSSHPKCVRLDLGTDRGKALTFVGSGEIRFPQGPIAVPAALNSPVCATMDRLWFLRPQEGSTKSEWSILEKIRLVTLQPLEEDRRNIIFRPAQTIRGETHRNQSSNSYSADIGRGPHAYLENSCEDA